MRTRRLALAMLPVAVAALVLLPAAPASAHPLGNFSINQYLGLTAGQGQLRARTIVDIAETPTLQRRPTVDEECGRRLLRRGARRTRRDHVRPTCRRCDGSCRRRADAVDGVQFGLRLQPGAGGLDVSRLHCTLTAAVRLDPRDEITVDNRYLADRVGWREMTATGDGVDLVDPTLPSASVSAELTSYPQDLLSSVLDVRTATLRIGNHSSTPGSADSGAIAALRTGGDPVSRWMATVDRRFQDLAGGKDLTPLVGLLAVGLAFLLGAGHAALPGHGKTVLAGYLAGKRGRARDAVTVAGTLTLTHTGGVLVLGLLITAGSRLAGERVFAWLGLVSGSPVLAVGSGMLLRIVRTRFARRPGQPGPTEYGHSHEHTPSAVHGPARVDLGVSDVSGSLHTSLTRTSAQQT